MGVLTEVLLKKGGAFGKTWQERFCVLDAEAAELLYFKSEADLENGVSPRGKMSLRNVEVEESSDGSLSWKRSQMYPFTLKLDKSGKNFYVLASC